MNSSAENSDVSHTNTGGKDDKHIVDVLIEERAQRLVASPLWPLYRTILYPLLLHGSAVKMADAIAALSGAGVMDYVSDLLRLDTRVTGLENLPPKGRVLIASTHPTGIPDGVAMYDALKGRRPDMTFFANRDAIRVSPGLEEVVIPVEWVAQKRSRLRSRETLAGAIKAFQEEKCVVLFPSGRLAMMNDQKEQVEQEWLPSVAIFARKYNCPIVPVRIEMRNSWLYYWFWKLNSELRDITLFHELLNKKGKTYKITFGEAISPDQLNGEPPEVAEALRRHASKLGAGEIKWSPASPAAIKNNANPHD
ncbi:1-acyl-sn-glycerol-3-phosphate acyltransferase [Hyphococcus flavus]|uniref:1-acyl-sn-glycerol-3-phosphate acyltransferase n=1 Tax=Hyphococcus flavus TaxID=1866326 RepID=A0AAE9ZDT3_9PROT|nr:1-acyl-sn-glycerol-3-phosphate acyltransferase [Hyphococcus flavus]WDI32959.1 1-acyl-sn-glycerol-3-phosphate acyltransferase [Hyphococcus flavus]